MANFPWSKNNKVGTSSNLSPRQVANKAYTLATKKLDKDDKRRRPQYSIRERLLLSNTMTKAEEFLNKRNARITNCRGLGCEVDDDVLILTPPPAPHTSRARTSLAQSSASETEEVKQVSTENPTPTTQKTENDSLLLLSEKQDPNQVTVSLVIAAAAAYTLAEKPSIVSRDCRLIMVPPVLHAMAPLATII
ncbi:hypothetical protein K501DRAFT_283614 [Backusella circina FSU 941]|nr:hypothetical protein K501DRAFT_283614 [Backusella circina FSU 941]